MSCYFASPLHRMARNIRVARARAQPVPGFPAFPALPPVPSLSLVHFCTYHRTLFP